MLKTYINIKTQLLDMAQNRMVLPVVTVTGFIVLIIGSLGYMGVFAISEVISNVLMVAGLLAVIIGMAMMMYQNKTAGRAPEED